MKNETWTEVDFQKSTLHCLETEWPFQSKPFSGIGYMSYKFKSTFLKLALLRKLMDDMNTACELSMERTCAEGLTLDDRFRLELKK